MNRKKRTLAAIMVVCLMAFMAGCGSSGPSASRDYKIKDCVTLGDYKELTKTAAAATKEDVELAIQSDLEAAAVPQQVKEGTVAEGDTVNIDYVGKKDGVAFDGGTAQGYDLAIGSGQFIDGFEDGLVGVSVGDTVDLDLTFPEGYKSQELAGQAVVFTVTVNYIHGEPELPSVEDYAASNQYESVDAYEEDVLNELNATKQVEAEQGVWDQAVGNATVLEYPQSEMDSAYENMKNYYGQLAAAWGMEMDEFLSNMGTSEETFEEDMLEYAQMAVAEKLVAFAIADAEGITISEEEYNAKIDEYIEQYDGYDTKEDIEAAVNPDDLRDQILMEKVRQFVLDSAVEVE